MKKRISALLLTMIMALASFTPAFAETPLISPAPLSDVPGSWCEAEVTTLMNKGIVSGYADGTYKAANPVTRGAIAKMVFLSMQDAGSTIAEFTTGDPFTDMKGNWAEGYVTALADIGVLVPSEYNNKFSAGTPMTRLETAKTLVRVYLHAHKDESLPASANLTFTDAKQIPAADAPYVAMAVEKGIINGYSDGSFKPGNSITRGTAAAMTSRFLDTVGIIQDTIMSAPSENRVDGEVNQNATSVPQIENVNWAVKPGIKINYNGTAAARWSEVSPDGMACYWTNDDRINPTFVDTNGKTYQFPGIAGIGPFVNGIAQARNPETGKTGYIDISGKWLLQPKYDRVDDFMLIYFKDGTSGYYGSAQEIYGTDHDTEWVIFDSNMNIVPWDISKVDVEKTVGPEYEEPTLPGNLETSGNPPTQDGLFVISDFLGDGGLRQPYYGICDKNGKILVRPAAATTSYGNAIHTAYYGGRAYDDCVVLYQQVSVRMDVLDDIYDGKTGELLYTCASSKEAAEYHHVDRRATNMGYGQGLFVTTDGSGSSEETGTSAPVGYMSKYGKMVIPAVFEDATPFSNGYAWVKYNGLWGMIKLPNF